MTVPTHWKVIFIVAKERLPSSWTTNIIKVIFKFGERNYLADYRITTLDHIITLCNFN